MISFLVQTEPKQFILRAFLKMSTENMNKELLDAVIGNHSITVKELLEQGADPNYFEDDAQIRPLHFAALYNSAEVIPLLVVAGASLSATTEYDDTPLMIAERHGHEEVVNILKKFHGAKVDHFTKQ